MEVISASKKSDATKVQSIVLYNLKRLREVEPPRTGRKLLSRFPFVSESIFALFGRNWSIDSTCSARPYSILMHKLYSKTEFVETMINLLHLANLNDF